MRRWGPPVLTLVGVIVAWQLVVVGFKVPEYLLPTPSGIVAAMAAEWRYLAFHTWVTLYEILWGFALAAVIGIPLAMLIVYSPAFERSVYPLLVASQSIPKIAIAPLLIFWAGIGIFPKVLVAFAISFFPIVIDAVVGLRAVEPEMLHLARSMGAPERKVFLKIRFPNALPNIFAGLKVAVTLAVVGAIVGEFIQADQGLGYALQQATAVLNTKLGFAAIFILAGVGIALFVAVEAVERWLTPWSPARRSELARGTL
ncbi:MAG: ABC transporter permease [Candidatus Rokubacteria bacterium]|nr:ABC transporter permease [Candidatus Rokubacteria bacterium]